MLVTVLIYSEPSSYFDINRTSGWIFVKGNIDRENEDILNQDGTIPLRILVHLFIY